MCLEAFCQSGGFDLFKLILAADPKTDDYKKRIGLNSFAFFTSVLRLVADISAYLEPDFYCELAYDIRDIATEYAKNLIDESSLRKVTKKEISCYIGNVEAVLQGVVSQKNRNSSPSKFEDEVYQYTEMMELEFALKCMKMPILEKKFIGHAILSQKINQVRAKQAQQESD